MCLKDMSVSTMEMKVERRRVRVVQHEMLVWRNRRTPWDAKADHVFCREEIGWRTQPRVRFNKILLLHKFICHRRIYEALTKIRRNPKAITPPTIQISWCSSRKRQRSLPDRNQLFLLTRRKSAMKAEFSSALILNETPLLQPPALFVSWSRTELARL